MIILMDTADLGKRCQNYLEEILDETNIENVNIVVWSNRHQIQVSDIDIFNQIAKKNGLDRIAENNGGRLSYYIVYTSDNQHDNFAVSLSSRLKDNFLNKYGGQYTLVR